LRFIPHMSCYRRANDISGDGVSDKLTDSIVALAVAMGVLVAVAAALLLRSG